VENAPHALHLRQVVVTNAARLVVTAAELNSALEVCVMPLIEETIVRESAIVLRPRQVTLRVSAAALNLHALLVCMILVRKIANQAAALLPVLHAHLAAVIVIPLLRLQAPLLVQAVRQRTLTMFGE